MYRYCYTIMKIVNYKIQVSIESRLSTLSYNEKIFKETVLST